MIEINTVNAQCFTYLYLGQVDSTRQYQGCKLDV